jgi:hypothetical protein
MANLGFATMTMIPTMRGARAEFQREIDELLRSVNADVEVQADTSKFVEQAKEGGKDGGSGLAAGIAGAATAAAAAALVVGAAAGAAFVKALSAGIDQDQLDRTLGARFGVSDEQAAAAGNAAGSAYAKGFGDSQADVGDALTAARFNFGDIWDPAQLQDISEKALGISKIFGGDVVESTRAAANLVKNGLAANSDEAFDLITKGYQGGLDISGDFLETINEYSVQWQKTGLSGADALGQLQRGLQGGARDTDKIADSMKEFSIRAIDGSDLTAQAFSDLGLSSWQMAQAISAGGPAAKDATSTIIKQLAAVQDKVKRDQIGVALFGTQWEDVGGQVIAGLDPAIGGLQDFAGSTDKALDEAGGGLGNMVEKWKRTAEVGLGDFAQENITPAVERIATAFQEGGIEGLFAQLGTEATGLATKVRAWFDQMLPVVQQWLQDNGPALAQRGLELLQTIGERFVEARSWLLARLSEWIPAIGEWIENVAVPFIEEHAGEWVSAFLEWAGPLAQEAIKALGDFLLVVGAWFVSDFIPWAQNKSAEWSLALLGWIATEAVPWLLQKMIELQAALGEWIAGTAIPWLLQKGSELKDALLAWLSELPGKIAEAAPGIWDSLVDTAIAAFKAILEAWNKLSLDVEVPSWVPGFGGQTYDLLPDVPIPSFHQGGIVPGSGERLSLLNGGEGVFTPEQMSALGTSGSIIVQGYHRAPADIVNEIELRRSLDLVGAVPI